MSDQPEEQQGVVRPEDIKRRTPEEITTLARETIMGQVLVANTPQVINAAFYMMLALTDVTKEAAQHVGALIGRMGDTVPGRAMNGYPIFLSMGFLHKEDMPAYFAELERMEAALR